MRKYLYIIFFTLTFSLFAQEINFQPAQDITDEISKSPVIQSNDFIQTVLLASGLSTEEFASYILKLNGIFEELNAELKENIIQDKIEISEYVLPFLYKKVFSSYSLNQTKVDVAIKTGVYNCVSSTVIFMYFMKLFEIPVVAVETPNHSFCTVTVDGENIDVETTNPYGFNPGVKKTISGDSNQTKYAVVPARDYYGRKNVDDRRILSLIYNNRIVALQKQKNNEKTIQLALNAMKLQNYSEQSLATFQMCISNTAIDLSSKGKNEDGINLILKASNAYGNCKLYSDFIEVTVGKIINLLQLKNQYNESKAVLEKYRLYLSESNYNNYLNVITINSLNYKINNDSFENSYNAVKENRNILSEKNYEKLLSLTYSYEADRVAKTGDYISAWKFLETALNELPNNSSLKNQIKVYKQNYAIIIHNEAARLVNSGDKSTAKEVILNGLKNVSDSSVLQNDLKRLE